jgi:hypothetical protein
VVALEEGIVGNLVALLVLVWGVQVVGGRLVNVGRNRSRMGARLHAGPLGGDTSAALPAWWLHRLRTFALLGAPGRHDVRCPSSSCGGHGSLRARLGPVQSRRAGLVEPLYDVMVGVKTSPRRRWDIGEAAADLGGIDAGGWARGEGGGGAKGEGGVNVQGQDIVCVCV